MTISINNVREWLQLIFLVIGGSIALVAFFQNQRQRKLENALKMVTQFKEALRENDLMHWRKLFIASSELAGGGNGFFRNESGDLMPLDVMFSEGSEDDDAIQRMAQNLEIICFEINAKTIEPRIIWYELGQLMQIMHQWLSEMDGIEPRSSFLETQYPAMTKTFKRYGKRFGTWPHRVIAYIE